MGSKGEININAYCKAFEIMGRRPDTGELWSETICSPLKSVLPGEAGTEFKKFVMYDSDADGRVSVPAEVKQMGGKWQVYRWREFGNDYATDRSDLGDHMRMLAAYFVAGAFGIEKIPEFPSFMNVVGNIDGEIILGGELDPSVVNVLQKTYRDCVKVGTDRCLNGSSARTAADTASVWTKIAYQKQQAKRAELAKQEAIKKAQELKQAAAAAVAAARQQAPAVAVETRPSAPEESEYTKAYRKRIEEYSSGSRDHGMLIPAGCARNLR